MHAGQPILAERGRWPTRGSPGTPASRRACTYAIQFDPCAYLISSADGPVTGDEDIDVACHAIEQPQRGDVVLDRVSGVVQVEQRNQDIVKHVAGDENAALLDQQRCMARGMRLMLDNPDLRAIPRNPRSFGGQTGSRGRRPRSRRRRADQACPVPAGRHPSGQQPGHIVAVAAGQRDRERDAVAVGSGWCLLPGRARQRAWTGVRIPFRSHVRAIKRAEEKF
jgi:hypothetical protein